MTEIMPSVNSNIRRRGTFRLFYLALASFAACFFVAGLSFWGASSHQSAPSISIFGFYVVMLFGLGTTLLWLPRIRKKWRTPIYFRASPDAAPLALQSRRPPLVSLLIAALGVVSLALTLGTLPFSKTSQMLSGFRSRIVDFPLSQPLPEDNQPADIYLLPLAPLERGMASHLANLLRKETGLVIAALPPARFDGLKRHKNNQVLVESIGQPMSEYSRRLYSPPQPRPHRPLLIALMPESCRSQIRDWNYVMQSGFSPVTAVICLPELFLELPLDEVDAQARLVDRVRKLCLRSMAFHIFEMDQSESRKSLLGPTLSSAVDLDRRTEPLALPRHGPMNPR